MAISNNDRRDAAPAGAMAILPRQNAPLAARTPEAAAMALERVVTMGDLRHLEPEERVAYYLDTCQSLGLNPRSRPFDWIEMDGKLVLYPNKSCTDQLRAVHHIRIETDMPTASPDGSMLRCVAKAWMPDGRSDTASKYVPITGYSRERGEYRLKGKELANAYMKAETGAKRRVTFSLIGLAAPPADVEDVQYRVLTVDGRGNILDNPTEEQRALAADPDMARVLREPTFEDLDPSRSPLAGTTDQRPADAPATPPSNPVPLRCDAAHWRAAYFAAVADTDLATDSGRAAFLSDYTACYSPSLRTDSLSRFLAHSTERQAREMVETARIRADKERAAQPPDQPQQHADPKVHAAAVLTGAHPVANPPAALPPARPEDGGEYTHDEWRQFYRVWGAELKRRDSAYALWSDADIKRRSLGDLVSEVWSCMGQCDSIDFILTMADEDTGEQPDETVEAF